MVTFTLNGATVQVDAPPDTPILEVIRNHFGLTGSKFGCGAAQCGACTIHVDGEPIFACVTDLETVAGTRVRTIEGLSEDGTHPLQRAWVAEQVPQCGYCQSGQIMRAAALLAENPSPSRAEIKDYMSPNLCRCGTYNRIVNAVARAAREPG